MLEMVFNQLWLSQKCLFYGVKQPGHQCPMFLYLTYKGKESLKINNNNHYYKKWLLKKEGFIK